MPSTPRRRDRPRRGGIAGILLRWIPVLLLLVPSPGADLSAQDDPRPDALRARLAAEPLGVFPLWVRFEPGRWRGGTAPELSPAAVRRRAMLGVPLSLPNDARAPEGLRAAVEATGARIREESRWLRALSVDADSAAAALAALPGVQAILPVARSLPVPTPRGPEPVPGLLPDTAYGPLLGPLELMRIPLLHELGFTGEGLRIGILDTGFRIDHDAFAETAVVATRDLIQDDTVVSDEEGDPPEQEGHGTSVWSLLGGNDPGRLVGTAFGAAYVLAKTEATGVEPRADEDRWVAGLEWLEARGARIVSSSLGYRDFDDFAYSAEDLDGETTPSALAAAEATRRGVLVVNAIGNEGPGTSSLVSPADGDSVLAVGAVDSAGNVASFSGRGPTADGRTKPELVAPGVRVPTASSISPGAYSSGTGTSFATPLVAGGAALLAEAYPDRGPGALRAALLAAGDARSSPGNRRGWGIPDVASAVFFPDDLRTMPVEEVTAGGRMTSLTPTFRWDAPTIHPVARPVEYRIEVAEDHGFTEIVAADTVSGVFARRLSRPLRPAETLFWRVVARTEPGTERVAAPVRGPLVVPPWVTLEVLDEPRGMTIDEPRPVFRWSAFEVAPPAGPLVFDLEILSGRDEVPIRRHPDLTETTFRVPEPLPVNTPLGWRIIARSPAGVADTVASAGPFVVTSRSEPPVTLLHQNFPNPVPRPELGEDETRIWIDVAREGRVELAVHDLRGRLVKRLIPAPGCPPQFLEPGLYGRDGSPDPGPCVHLRWDGRDGSGDLVERGVYLLRLRAADAEASRRIVFWP